MLDAGSLVSGLRCLQLPEQSADDFAYGQRLPLTAGGYLAAYLPAALAAIWLLFPHCRVTYRAACTSTKSS